MVEIICALLSAAAAIIVCVINANANQKKLVKEQDKKDKEREERESQRDKARQEHELILIRSTGAAIALGEATAKAVQRIPDAHCNGDMHAALKYAAKVKHEQKDFLASQGIAALFD